MTGTAQGDVIDGPRPDSRTLPRVLLLVLCVTIGAAWVVGLSLVLA